MYSFLKKKILLFTLVLGFFSSVGLFAIPQKAHASMTCSLYLGTGTCVDNGNVIVTSITDTNAANYFAQNTQALATAQQKKQQDTISNWWNQTKLGLMSSLEKGLARSIVQQITNSIVQWINNGFQGQPAFPDPQQFLSNVADQTIGNMIFNDPDLKKLCSPFQLQVQAALVLSYSPKLNQMGCTLTSVVKNVTNAVNNASINVNVNVNSFTQQGGWANWLSMTADPMNNAEGAYLIKKSADDQLLADKKAAANQELKNGQGSLTYGDCTKTDAKTGQTVGHYVGSPSYDATSQPGVSVSGSVNGINQTCTIKTPGAIITSELGWTANEPGFTGDLESALGTGIDQIFGNLLNAMVSKVQDQLSNGILANNNGAAYQQALDNIPGVIASNTVSSMQILTATSGDLSTILENQTENPLNNVFGNDYSSSSGISALFNETNINSQVQQTTGTGENSLQISDLANITNLINEETSYQNTYSQAAQVLTDADAIFKNARACNTSYASSTTALKAQLITDNIITNIEGTPDYARTTPTISWNLAAIQTDIAAENTKLSELAAAQQAVTDATDTPSTIAAMIPVSSGQFGLAPDQGLISNIQTWVKDIAPFYASSLCPIDVSSVVNATSTAN